MTAKQQIEILNRMRHDVYEDSEEDQVLYYAIRAIEQLEGKDTDVPSKDTISREDAKEAYCKKLCCSGAFCPDGRCREVNETFDSIPSAQPDIIRCKDCKHRGEDECPMHHVEWVEYDDDGYIDSDDVIYDYTEDDGYCFKAER